jgi:hypothetical protein
LYFGSYGGNSATDSLSYYSQRGFTCDTLRFNYWIHDHQTSPSRHRPYCGSKKDIERFSKGHNKCKDAGKQTFPF